MPWPRDIAMHQQLHLWISHSIIHTVPVPLLSMIQHSLPHLCSSSLTFPSHLPGPCYSFLSPLHSLSAGFSPHNSTSPKASLQAPIKHRGFCKMKTSFSQSEEPIYKSSHLSVVIYAPSQLLQQTPLVGFVLFSWYSFSSRIQYLSTKLHSFNFPCESVDCLQGFKTAALLRISQALQNTSVGHWWESCIWTTGR